MNTNEKFLNSVSKTTKQKIIGSIAKHYGATEQDIMDEVTGDDAENLCEYMVEPERSATYLMMQQSIGQWR